MNAKRFFLEATRWLFCVVFILGWSCAIAGAATGWNEMALAGCVTAVTAALIVTLTN